MSFLPKNVRTRLTLWFVLSLSVILIIYASVSFSLLYVNLKNNLDDQLQQDYEIVEDLIELQAGGKIDINSDNDPYFHERWFQIWSTDGRLIYENRIFTSQNLPPLNKEEINEGGFRFHSLRLKNNARVRILSGKINIEGKWLFIRLIRSEDKLWHELSGYFNLMLVALPLAILIAGFGGYFLTRKLLSPIIEMTSRAKKISEENLKERLPVINPEDELGKLALAFNEMLERIEKSFERLKRFTSDAAHELRTPLTAIRSIGEVAMQDYKNARDYREIIGSMLEENSRLIHLVDNLLFLSRADGKILTKNPEKLELKTFAKETIELIAPLSEEKLQTITIKCNHQVVALADRTLLKQAFLNLLDNAIKYSPEHSQIIVSIFKEKENRAVLEVKDNGPGISEEHLNKIFERFYRVDRGRSRTMGGSGLGLAIARWAVKAQGGYLTVVSKLGIGSSFKIFLPLAGKNITT